MGDKELLKLEKDAARFRHLQNIDPKNAQAFFWTYSSRTERRKAIDADMAAAAAIATQEGE